MNPTDPRDLMRFANETGLEIFNLLLKRSDELGEQPFQEILGAMTAATAICLANVVRPAVEAADNRELAAESLIAVCTKQARRFLDPVIAEGR